MVNSEFYDHGDLDEATLVLLLALHRSLISRPNVSYDLYRTYNQWRYNDRFKSYFAPLDIEGKLRSKISGSKKNSPSSSRSKKTTASKKRSSKSTKSQELSKRIADFVNAQKTPVSTDRIAAEFLSGKSKSEVEDILREAWFKEPISRRQHRFNGQYYYASLDYTWDETFGSTKNAVSDAESIPKTARKQRKAVARSGRVSKQQISNYIIAQGRPVSTKEIADEFLGGKSKAEVEDVLLHTWLNEPISRGVRNIGGQHYYADLSYSWDEFFDSSDGVVDEIAGFIKRHRKPVAEEEILRKFFPGKDKHTIDEIPYGIWVARSISSRYKSGSGRFYAKLGYDWDAFLNEPGSPVKTTKKTPKKKQTTPKPEPSKTETPDESATEALIKQISEYVLKQREPVPESEIIRRFLPDKTTVEARSVIQKAWIKEPIHRKRRNGELHYARLGFDWDTYLGNASDTPVSLKESSDPTNRTPRAESPEESSRKVLLDRISNYIIDENRPVSSKELTGKFLSDKTESEAASILHDMKVGKPISWRNLTGDDERYYARSYFNWDNYLNDRNGSSTTTAPGMQQRTSVQQDCKSGTDTSGTSGTFSGSSDLTSIGEKLELCGWIAALIAFIACIICIFINLELAPTLLMIFIILVIVLCISAIE